MPTGLGASWTRTARWRYRLHDDYGHTSGPRYADTLADIRTDMEGDEDAVACTIQKRVRNDWVSYGRIVWGADGPRVVRD